MLLGASHFVAEPLVEFVSLAFLLACHVSHRRTRVFVAAVRLTSLKIEN